MTPSPASRARQGGFTMIEVMVALLLTAVAVVGIIALYMTGTRASSFSRHATEASVLANDKLEKLRTMALPVAGTDSNLTEQGQPGGIFGRSWTVTTGASYHDLAVTVTWQEDGISRSVIVYGRRNL